MSKAFTSNYLWAGLAGLLFAPLVGAQAVFPFDSQLTLSDPCAIFNAPTTDPNITRITYGEDIDFNLTGQSQAIIDVDSLGKVHLKFQVTTHGDGIGQTSGIKYQFQSKVMVKSNVGGYDPLGLDPLDEGFVYNGSFAANARINGQGSAGDAGGIAQGAQDNALLRFKLGLHYANGEVRNSTSDFTLQCVASPWANLMKQPNTANKKPVGRGFGDVWNKYAWSMKSFNGGMVVGTKNAFYDVTEVLNPSDAIQQCLDSNFYQVTPIHSQIACMELFAAPNSGTSPAAADTRFAEIWRFDYVKKSWTKVFDEGNAPDSSQGFRYMETHNGKLYVGSDLGAFITGVDLYEGGPYDWSFPGSQLLVSTDGKTFNAFCRATDHGTPCNSATHADNPYGLIGTYRGYHGCGEHVDPCNGLVQRRVVRRYLQRERWTAVGVSGGSDSGPEWRFVHSFQPVPFSGYPPPDDILSAKARGCRIARSGGHPVHRHGRTGG